MRRSLILSNICLRVFVVLVMGGYGSFCLGETPADSPRTTLRLPTPAPPEDSVVDEHPMLPVLQSAISRYQRSRSDVDDYTCIVVRRERLRGQLGPHEFMYAKVRHRRQDGDRLVVPFSVYLKFLKPRSVVGREVLYVEGQNDGEMFARRGGTRFAFVTMRIDPRGELAMRSNRYPITEFGFENLLYQLIGSARQGLNYPCQVDYLEGAKINQVPATGVVVTQRTREQSPEVYQSRIFVDKKTDLPIHYEAYGWPTQGDSAPPLLEQYTYTNVQLNVGLTDADFSADNPQYRVK